MHKTPATPKTNPFAGLSALPARERPSELGSEPAEANEAAPISHTTTASDPAPPGTLSHGFNSAAPEAPAPLAPPKFPSEKSLREKRTTRINPNVYDAVERELTRQKRKRERATSTLSDLLDELLRNWLQTRGIEV